MKNSKHESETEQVEATPANDATGARRKLLSTGAVGAAAALLGVIAVACGSDDDSAPSGAGGASAGATGKAGASGKAGATGSSGATGKAGSNAGGASNEAGSVGIAGVAGEEPAAAGAGGEGGAASTPDADITPLNALLNAEYNAITAYTAGAGLIGSAKTTDPLYALREVITDVAVSIQAQHKLHAASLVDAIETLGGAPVKEADVAAKFKAPAALTANPSISNVLKFAASAERGAAVAYNQVLAGMEDAKLRFLASAIEGDETQHFIVLTALVLGLASPGANLSTTTASKVVPEPFVSTVGAQGGLDKAPPDYFA